MQDPKVLNIIDILDCVPMTRAMPAFVGDMPTYLRAVFAIVAKEAAEDALRIRAQDYSCHEAAAQMLPAMLKHAHGHGVMSRVCDDGSVALEMRGESWRLLVSFEPDPTESGWSWVQTDRDPQISRGPLDEIEKLWYWLDARLSGCER